MSEPSDELSALATALRGLAPSAGAIDRDALLFQAGRATAPSRWPWAVAALASTTATGVLALLLALRPAPPVVERIHYLPAPAAPVEEPSSVPPQALRTGAPTHWQLQEHVLERGLSGLGEAPAFRPSILPTQGEDPS